MAVVVPLVVLPVRGMQFLQPGHGLLDRGIRREIQDQRFDLGAQEMVRARGAQRTQPGVFGAFEEVQDGGVVAEVPDDRFVAGGQPAEHRRQRGGPGAPRCFRQGRVAGQFRAEGFGPAVFRDVLFGLLDDPQGVRLGLLAGGAPGGGAVAAQDGADGLRVGVLDRGDVQAQLETGAPPRHPRHLVPEDPRGQRFAVGGRGDRDPRVRVEVVHVGGVHQPMHGGVDRGGGPALAEQAVVERGHHLVLAVDAGVDLLQGLQPVQAQDREPGLRSACPGPRRSP